MTTLYKGRAINNKSGRGYIVSQGVTEHIQTQRPVHQKGRIPDNLIAIRKRNRNTPYPISHDDDFVCKQWDILARVAGEDLASAKDTNNYVIQVPVCSTPAGLTGLEDIQFLGLCLKTGDLNSDSVGPTVAYLQSGVCTMHACEESINAGDMVYMDWPGIVVAGGVNTPKSHIPTRNRKGRFTWVPRPLTMGSIFKQFHGIAVILSKSPQDGPDQDEAETFINKHSFYKNLPFDEKAKVCPLTKYWVWAVKMLETPILTENNAVVEHVLEEQKREAAAFQSALNGNGAMKRHKASTPGVNRLEVSREDNIMMRIFATTLYPMQLAQEQMDLYQRRIIGKAVTSTLAGGQFEIEVGYRW